MEDRWSPGKTLRSKKIGVQISPPSFILLFLLNNHTLQVDLWHCNNMFVVVL
jgi:hypothetical protein